MINNPNSKEVPVLLNDPNNKYELYESPNEKVKIWGIFTQWEKPIKKAKEIEIFKNNYNGHIIEVRFVNQKKCDSEKTCNELQLICKNGRPNTGVFSIKNGYCDFNNTQVKIIHFTDPEIVNGEHKKPKCSNCYDDPGIPKTSKGNVIVGG